MDLNRECLCPNCTEPMRVRLPIWYEPGSEYVDSDEVDWDSGNSQCSSNWYCTTCSSHHFPIDNESTETVTNVDGHDTDKD